MIKSIIKDINYPYIDSEYSITKVTSDPNNIYIYYQ